jgi:hypothetical protein
MQQNWLGRTTLYYARGFQLVHSGLQNLGVQIDTFIKAVATSLD